MMDFPGKRFCRSRTASEEGDDAASVPRPRGRRPSFDRSEALHQAMRLFWERGYEGTSFDDLIAAMGISASSFQNAFGSKQQAYEEATALYRAEKGRWLADTLSAESRTRDAFAKLLETSAEAFTQRGEPTGCMIALATLQAAPSCERIRDMMVEQRALAEARLRERLQQGVAAGELPPDTDTEALANYFGTVIRGMAVQARDGASREHLRDIGRVAMQAWPGGGVSPPPSAAPHPAPRR